MTIRSGGRYEMRSGKPVLVERSGYTPEQEAKAAKPADTQTAPKSATKKENTDADA